MQLELIKNSVEEVFKTFNLDVNIEFVDDVKIRRNEITSIDNNVWSEAYETSYCTGTFIPSTKKHKAFILVLKRDDVGCVIETVFHEMRHAIDYNIFLKNIFNNDQDMMKQSPLYVTFNIYSEFEAIKFGYENYIKVVDYEGITKQELAERLLEEGIRIYDDFEIEKNRKGLLYHAVSYFARLCAVEKFLPNFSKESYLQDILEIDLLEGIFTMLVNPDVRDKQWFERFDKLCREYVR